MKVLPLILIYLFILFSVFKQLSYVRKFKKKKAVHSGSAKLLSELGVNETKTFRHLISKGVFVQTKENRFYMNEEKAKEYARKRRSIIYVTTFFFLFFFLFIVNNNF